MKEDIEKKLDKISKIWNNFILRYKFCTLKIQFTDDVKTNYLGDIQNYFSDTLDVVFIRREEKSYSDKFANVISLLQAIYIHQDLIEELLLIFKCQTDKGELKKDANYSINRNLRNELIGHPIRKKEIPKENALIDKCDQCGNLKVEKKLALISSITFSYNSNRDTILYLRYHRDNDFKMEQILHNVTSVVERHQIFVNTYLDKILDKLKIIVSEFSNKLSDVDKTLINRDFDTILSIVEVFFEDIFKSDYAYEKRFLLEIYKKRNDHDRYQNFINIFIQNLKSALHETRENIMYLFDKKEINTENVIYETPLFDDVDTVVGVSINPKANSSVTYHYELGKLASNRNQFDFFSRLLRSKCSENLNVLKELDHMEANITSEIEFYSSHKLICTLLGED